MLLSKAALHLYLDSMEGSFENVETYIGQDELKFVHLEAKEKALDQV